MGRNARTSSKEDQGPLKSAHDYAKKYTRQIARTKDRNEKYIGRIEAATYDKRFVPMHEILPEGKLMRGKEVVEISHFEISSAQSAVSKLRATLNPDTRWYEYVAPGKYTRLTINGTLFMTDTGHERFSSLPLIDNARGNVLVSGLGLGMVIPPLVRKPEVKRVYVVEKEYDVIALIVPLLTEFFRPEEPTLSARRWWKKLHVTQGDAWTWNPYDKTVEAGTKFDTIFHDIWATFGPELLPEFRKLKRRYRKWLAKDGWMGCWAEETCRQLRREEIRKFREVQAAIGGDVTKLPPLEGVWETDE